ncbi:MAG: AAA family ATPase [Planctomycetota bacterium]
MIRRILNDRLRFAPKSVLLLGPRQVGKSTLCRSLEPDLEIQLADEETYQEHVKDPGLLKRVLAARPQARFILLDEVQRVPSLLNTVQAIVDRNPEVRFLITGSSARKLRRGRANLLPGRMTMERLSPLLYWELGDRWDLDRALSVGSLPEIYLEDYGAEILESYATLYLREEIQAEALTRDLGAYARFLDVAAEMSGQFVNYAKLASDTGINEMTIRRYMEILSDTLLIERLPSFTGTDKRRRARSKDRYLFFDLGVRNALLGRHQGPFSSEETGNLFEQWLILQVLYLDRTRHLGWKISSYRDMSGLEVDLLIETPSTFYAVEIKASRRVHGRMFRNLKRFANLVDRPVESVLVYRGEVAQRFEGAGLALPYGEFLDRLGEAEDPA